MKYVDAFTPCSQKRQSEWHVNHGPDGEPFGTYGNHNLFIPYHPMWWGNNTWDTNCLTQHELSEFKRQNKLAGWPEPIVSEPFDAYQMDFWSAGTQYLGTEELL
jgi:hypothetical protein